MSLYDCKLSFSDKIGGTVEPARYYNRSGRPGQGQEPDPQGQGQGLSFINFSTHQHVFSPMPFPSRPKTVLFQL